MDSLDSTHKTLFSMDMFSSVFYPPVFFISFTISTVQCTMFLRFLLESEARDTYIISQVKPSPFDGISVGLGSNVLRRSPPSISALREANKVFGV